MLGAVLDRGLEGAQRGLRSPALDLEDAEVVQAVRVIGVAGEDAAIELFGLGQVAGVVLGDGLLQHRVDGEFGGEKRADKWTSKVNRRVLFQP